MEISKEGVDKDLRNLFQRNRIGQHLLKGKPASFEPIKKAQAGSCEALPIIWVEKQKEHRDPCERHDSPQGQSLLEQISRFETQPKGLFFLRHSPEHQRHSRLVKNDFK